MSEEPRAQNALEAAMLRAAAAPDDDAAIESFLTTLAGAELHVPLEAAPEAAEHDEGEVRLPIREADDRAYVAAFSSKERMRSLARVARFARLTGGELASEWEGDVWLAVNPGGEPTAAVPPEAVRTLPERSQEDSGRVYLGEPDPEPRELLDALRGGLPRIPEVRAAYRAQALVDAPGEEPRLVVGLVVDGSELAVEAAAALAREHATVPVDFLRIEEGEPLGDWLVRNTEPFYSASSASSSSPDERKA